MNVSFNISSPTVNPSQVEDLTQVKQTEKSEKTLTVSIGTGVQGADKTGVPNGITLSYPLVDLDKIALDKVMDQLKGLDLDKYKGMKLADATLQMNQDIGEIAAAIIKGGKPFVEKNAAELTKFFTGIEAQAKKTETQLFDLINKSTYPDFRTFLGKILAAAQELRELASEAKHKLVMGEFNNILDQAKQMEIAAEKNYQSTLKEIKASQMESIGKIVSGVVSIASIGVAGLAGGMQAFKAFKTASPTKPGALGAGFGGGLQTAGMLGAPVGNALGGIIEGSAGHAAGKERMDAAVLKKEADLANALKTKLEATGKLLQEAESITEELREIAKTLADAVLRMHQDLISNQHQIIQRANI